MKRIPLCLLPLFLVACASHKPITHVPDTPPRVLFAAPLELPQNLQSNPPKDNAAFKLTVTSDGKPADIHCTHSCGNAEVDALCSAIIKHYKFRPATRDGKPASGPLTLTFNFKP